MILGTGIDMIEIERVYDVFTTDRRKKRVFTSGEIEMSGKSKSRLAGFYAAKEAFSKALGTGIKGISFKEIEVLKDQDGKPYINMELASAHLVRRFGEKKFQVHLSISHDRERAVAMVMIEEE